MSDENVAGYGVLVRHHGFIDRLIPEEQYAHYPVDNINHWLGGPARPALLKTEADAQALADDLAGKFGEQRYMFLVAVCRMVPRWYVHKPSRTWDRVEISPEG